MSGLRLRLLWHVFVFQHDVVADEDSGGRYWRCIDDDTRWDLPR